MLPSAVRLISADYVQNKDDQTIIFNRVQDPPITDADPIQVVELPPYQFLTAARPWF